MAVDGSLTFDTRIDTDGFSGDLKDIVNALKGISTSLKNIERIITGVFGSMQSEASAAADSIESVSEAADSAERSVERLEESVWGLDSEDIGISVDMGTTQPEIDSVQQSAEQLEADLHDLEVIDIDIPIDIQWEEIPEAESYGESIGESIAEGVESTAPVAEPVRESTENAERESLPDAENVGEEIGERIRDGIGDPLGGVQASLRNILKLLAAAFGMKELLKFGKQSIELASDIQEVQNVVDTAFGDMSYKMEEFADTAVKRFGMSKLSAKQTGSTFMAMADGIGLANETASDMAISLTGLSADMASFYNIEQEAASTALNSIFTGETETLKKFGIVMTEANLEAYALSQGITKSLSAMTQAEKVQLRYAYVMEQSALAQGDFSKTSGSWANQTRILSEQWKEFSSTIGTLLMNLLLPAVKALNNALSTLIGYAETAVNTIAKLLNLNISGGSAAAGVLLENTAGISDGISDSVENQNALTDAVNETAEAQQKSLAGFDEINTLTSKTAKNEQSANILGAVPTAQSVSVGADTKPLENETVKSLKKIQKQLAKIFKPFKITFSGIWDGLKAKTAELYTTLSGIFADIRTLGEPLREYFSGDFTVFLRSVFSYWGVLLTGLFDTFNMVFSDIWNVAVFPILSSFIEYGLPVITQFGTEVFNTLSVFFTEVKEIFDMLWQEAVVPVLGFIAEVWEDLMESISEFWDKWGAPIFDAFREAITNTGDTLQNIWNQILKPVFDKLMETADKIWSNHLRPLIDNFLDFVGTLIDGALDIYNEFILPLVNWFADKFGAPIAAVFGWLLDTAGDIIGGIIDAVSHIIDALKGVVDFVAGVFTGDWDRAWQGIKDIFKGVWDAFVDIVKAPINLIIDLVNGLTGAIETGLNWIIDGINEKLSVDIPNEVPVVGGTHFGLDIPNIDIPEIPHLAQGTVVPANYGEFLAVLGDNKREAEVVSPISAIEEAVTRAMKKSSGSGGDLHIHVDVDGREIGRIAVKYTELEKARRGQ